ncbi:MAG TPA: 30S ribosomal protein S4 [Candidatus Woesebacteria bacterium]|nr:30S ribosomal protein S4 [Candidatus Woesebacteria bacterium]
MSRVTYQTKCRLCRAEGIKLFLKGSRCSSAKCPLEKKGAIPPGMHGLKGGKKPTDYGIQLRAKQKAKRIYGVQETQFKNYYLKAKSMKGLVGTNLLTLLELRLDNIVYKAGLASSRSHAKQLVSHKNILVNGKPLNVCSYQVKKTDQITLDSKIISSAGENLPISEKDFKSPAWISIDRSKFGVEINGLPSSEDFNSAININLIIEYYSR